MSVGTWLLGDRDVGWSVESLSHIEEELGEEEDIDEEDDGDEEDEEEEDMVRFGSAVVRI